MTALPVLAWRLLRFRVAAMVWTFMLPARRIRPASRPSGSDLGGVALGAGYVAATSANDVADVDVDRVNHPGDRRGRWSWGRRRCATCGGCTSSHGLRSPPRAARLGEAVAVVIGSLVIGVAYSLPPARLAYRTWLAPLALASAYVLVPYGLERSPPGGIRRGGRLARRGALLPLPRADRAEGLPRPGRRCRVRQADAAAPLRLGATCAVSLVALAVGNGLLIVALDPPLLVALALEAPVVGIAVFLHRLRTAEDARAEQIAIGLGARLGNGLLLGVLAWLVLGGEGASDGARAAFAGVRGAVRGEHRGAGCATRAGS